jgi:hypothetical protein
MKTATATATATKTTSTEPKANEHRHATVYNVLLLAVFLTVGVLAFQLV